MKNHVNKEELFYLQYCGLMRLVRAMVFQILDYISISKKWNDKEISYKTLIGKKDKLIEMRSWLKDWKWGVWLKIYTEHFGGEVRTIKKNFIRIRTNSQKEVNKRIRQYENKIKNKSNIIETTLGEEK